MKNTMTIAVIIALVGAVVAVSGYAWVSMGDVAMTTNGWVALILGILFTVAIGCGLMALVFFSDRSGLDESVGAQRRESDPHGRTP